MNNTIRTTVIISFSTLIIGIIATSILSLINSDVLGFLQRFISYQILLLLLCLTIAILLTMILLYDGNKDNKLPKTKLIYSIFWDKKGNPFCPVCKSPLTVQTSYILKCHNCKNNNLVPKNSSSASVSIISVKNNINKLWKEY